MVGMNLTVPTIFANACIFHKRKMVKGFDSGFSTINIKRHSNPPLIGEYEK
jgi:hypothetical protein